MFDQNKEWTKFRQIFKGLKRVHERAKRPNKITEYDMPVANDAKIKKYKTDQKEKGAEIEFDPCAMLDAEFEQDEIREKEAMEKVYGKEYVSQS